MSILPQFFLIVYQKLRGSAYLVKFFLEGGGDFLRGHGFFRKFGKMIFGKYEVKFDITILCIKECAKKI